MTAFDRVYLINLKTRTDRLAEFRQRQQQRGWKLPEPILFPAIRGDTVGVPKSFTQGGGAFGCRQSHIGCLQLCLMDGVESVLVFEDDAEWFDECWPRLDTFLRAVPADWDCLMLGGWHERPAEPVAPGVCRAVKVGYTHAYAVRGRAMKFLLGLWNDTTVHIDWVNDWQRDWKVYCPDPFLFGQAAGRSDISGRTRQQPAFSGPGTTRSPVKADRVYSHAGDVGDLIAALPVLAVRPGTLRLVRDKCTAGRMTPERVESLRLLLLAQGCVRGVEWADGYRGERLDKGLRQHYQKHLNISDMQCAAFNVAHWPREKPWLTVPAAKRVAKVVFARSARHRSQRFPWALAWQKYGREAVFVGTAQEHAAFQWDVGMVAHHSTADFLELAEVIAGAELVVTNQTAAFWIAEGLKRPLILEVAAALDNCNFARPGHVHAAEEHVALPDLNELNHAAGHRSGRRTIKR